MLFVPNRCLGIRPRTEVGRKVGLSHNGVNRPTDKPGPRYAQRCAVEFGVPIEVVIAA